MNLRTTEHINAMAKRNAFNKRIPISEGIKEMTMKDKILEQAAEIEGHMLLSEETESVFSDAEKVVKLRVVIDEKLRGIKVGVGLDRMLLELIGDLALLRILEGEG